MLYLNTVESSTLELLKKLQNEELLKDTYLVGGTSLALRKGYRKSIDLDLFTRTDFDAEEISLHLQDKYGFKETFRRNYTLKGDINKVKIDILKYDYEFIETPELIDGIRMLSIPDIIAMKLAVISDTGTRVKDFVDIAFLSQEYSLKEMLSFFSSKYPNSNPMGPLTGINYYEDIDHSDPVNLIGFTYRWENIKERLEKMVVNYERPMYLSPCPKEKSIHP